MRSASDWIITHISEHIRVLYEAAVSHSKPIRWKYVFLTLCDRTQHVDVHAEKRPPTPSAQRKLSVSIPPGETCKTLGGIALRITHDGILVHTWEKCCWASTGRVASWVNTVLLRRRVVSPRSVCFRLTSELSLCGIRSTGVHSGNARAPFRKFNSYERELTVTKRALRPVESSRWSRLIMCFSLTVKCSYCERKRAITALPSLWVYE